MYLCLQTFEIFYANKLFKCFKLSRHASNLYKYTLRFHVYLQSILTENYAILKNYFPISTYLCRYKFYIFTAKPKYFMSDLFFSNEFQELVYKIIYQIIKHKIIIK